MWSYKILGKYILLKMKNLTRFKMEFKYGNWLSHV